MSDTEQPQTTSTGEVPGEEDWAAWPIVLQAVRSEIGKAQARGRPWDRPTTIGEVAMECRTMPACVERLIALCGYLISYVRDDSKPMTDWIVFEDGIR